MTDPKIYLGIDNCFAIKRWTAPADWMRVIKDLGMRYIEGVADLEIEPLLTPEDYQQAWIDEVNELQAREGMQVVMMYSNDSTYDTIGLAHPDPRVREHLVHKWFDRFIRTSAAIGASLGYYVQAYPERILYDKAAYAQAERDSFASMVAINHLAEQYGVDKVALEQMYTPHQTPFTIDGMKKLMRDMMTHCKKPLYVTEDLGHHCPYYLRPNEDALNQAYARYCRDGYISIWLGSREAHNLFTREIRPDGKLDAGLARAIQEDMAQNPHLFNTPRDTDCYEWLRELGCYSPVIHLQQTDGTHSSHQGFLPAYNETGKIHPVEILKALQTSYQAKPDAAMPPPCEDIYLIQELYLSTKDIGYQGLYKLAQSTDYLRKFIPRDGMRLSELIALNEH